MAYGPIIVELEEEELCCCNCAVLETTTCADHSQTHETGGHAHACCDLGGHGPLWGERTDAKIKAISSRMTIGSFHHRPPRA